MDNKLLERAEEFYRASFGTAGASAYDPQAPELIARFAEMLLADHIAELRDLREKLATAYDALCRIKLACDYAARHARGMYGFTKYVEAHGTITSIAEQALAEIGTEEERRRGSEKAEPRKEK